MKIFYYCLDKAVKKTWANIWCFQETFVSQFHVFILIIFILNYSKLEKRELIKSFVSC